jgi:hypothetical protein
VVITAVAVIVVVVVVPVVVGDGSDALGAEGSIWSMFWEVGMGMGIELILWSRLRTLGSPPPPTEWC